MNKEIAKHFKDIFGPIGIPGDHFDASLDHRIVWHAVANKLSEFHTQIQNDPSILSDTTVGYTNSDGMSVMFQEGFEEFPEIQVVLATVGDDVKLIAFKNPSADYVYASDRYGQLRKSEFATVQLHFLEGNTENKIRVEEAVLATTVADNPEWTELHPEFWVREA